MTDAFSAEPDQRQVRAGQNTVTAETHLTYDEQCSIRMQALSFAVGAASGGEPDQDTLARAKIFSDFVLGNPLAVG